MKRLFFALWPDDDTRQRFQKIVRSLRGYGRPVSVMNVHATLVFLGNLDEVKQAAMMQAADNIVVEPMRLMFDRLQYWKKPAVVCLCAEQTDPGLANVVESLNAAAIQQEIEVDRRPYKPHVTLLRKAKSLPEISFDPILWQLDGFCLVESCSTPDGVEYKVLKRWPSPSLTSIFKKCF